MISMNQNPEQNARDKTSLDIFWLKDESLTDLDNLPDPDVLAAEIVENLEAGLESFREINDATPAYPDLSNSFVKITKIEDKVKFTEGFAFVLVRAITESFGYGIQSQIFSPTIILPRCSARHFSEIPI